ncbi:hypothetical protein PVAP13_1NG199095 [Panicum virgatum]|uniref:Uncharacterized protein n=1 Tax=Panicum virgatum TaxID=38727 RepID=A0A8T0X0B6_PANVG|nr:hypothetical protein PVAP13_1NG199095 [Panicum virgatum]
MRLCTQRLQRGLASPPLARGSAPATPVSMVAAGGGCAPVQAMTVARDLHMATGDGEHSYAVNSIFQRKTVMETWPELRKAVKEAVKSLSPGLGARWSRLTSAARRGRTRCSSSPR